MAKVGLTIVAIAFVGVAAIALSVVVAPKAKRAFQQAHSVPSGVVRGMAPATAQLAPRTWGTGVVTLAEVTIVGDPHSALRQHIIIRRAEPRSTETAKAKAVPPCSPQWLALRSGPTTRHFRELCPNELVAEGESTAARPESAADR